MTERDLSILVLGESAITLRAKTRLSAGETLEPQLRGSAIKTALAAARAGAAVALVSRIADDALGRWLVETWEDSGLHLDFTRRVAGRNSLVLEGGQGLSSEQISYRDSGPTTQLEATDLDAVPWERTGIVFATGELQALSPSARNTVSEAFRRGRAHGCFTVYDPTSKLADWPESSGAAAPRAALDEVLGLVDLLLLDAPLEAGRLLGRAEADEAARAARHRGAGAAVIRTRTGCVIANTTGLHTVKGTHPLDPSGFTGRLLAAIAAGADVRAACKTSLRDEHKS